VGDKMRWLWGDTNPVLAAVDSETVIEIGDLLFQDTDDAKPASEAANQERFADAFLGVAMQRSRAGDTDPIRVATTGVFEFDCRAGTFELGDLVGGDDNGAGSDLLNQWVAQVPRAEPLAACAIGRVARREPLATTTVLVDIRSRVMTNGVL